MNKQVILTGLRANGQFHLGNYLGSILPMVALQKRHAGEYQINMFIPDLHSFTTPIDHRKLHKQILDNLRLFVAAGIDIHDKDTYIYRQSRIAAHSEMQWILSCFTYFGELARMTQFKEKSRELTHGSGDGNQHFIESLTGKSVTTGLFNYPVLMAADILLYGAQWVPVGDDQKQHLELTRDIAARMNNKFKDIFPEGLLMVPYEWKRQLEFSGLTSGVRIRSLRNPEKKMSKSISDPSGTIMLDDAPNDAAKKIMGATTDSLGVINFDWERQPGISNLLQILALLEGRRIQDVSAEWNGKTKYGELKAAVADRVQSLIGTLHEAYVSIDEAEIRQQLEVDEQNMRIIAEQTLTKVQQAVGLRDL